MNPVLKLLTEGGSLTTSQMAKVAGMTEAEVQQHLEQLKKDKIFLGWRPVLDLSHEAAAAAAVRAVIEVKITPERGGGFNRFADRIARFDEVESCYLMSGGYDLLVFVKGASLQKVASFVSEKLSTIEGVLSTSTHFMLRCYKEQGFLLHTDEAQGSRLNVAPLTGRYLQHEQRPETLGGGTRVLAPEERHSRFLRARREDERPGRDFARRRRTRFRHAVAHP